MRMSPAIIAVSALAWVVTRVRFHSSCELFLSLAPLLLWIEPPVIEIPSAIFQMFMTPVLGSVSPLTGWQPFQPSAEVFVKELSPLPHGKLAEPASRGRPTRAVRMILLVDWCMAIGDVHLATSIDLNAYK
jgi:hypothetical protein